MTFFVKNCEFLGGNFDFRSMPQKIDFAILQDLPSPFSTLFQEHTSF